MNSENTLEQAAEINREANATHSELVDSPLRMPKGSAKSLERALAKIAEDWSQHPTMRFHDCPEDLETA